MSRKNIQHITLTDATKTISNENAQSSFTMAEDIDIKSSYSKEDIHGLKQLDFVAGLAPNLRGPYSTMYVSRPWTIRQYAGFSTAEASNACYRRTVAEGQNA